MAPVRNSFLVFGSPDIREEEIAEVVDSLRSGWLGTGPKVDRFEKEFKAYIGAPYAIALNSCTAALHLSMLVSGIGPGDEVITTPMTFCATANAIVHTGARPVFVDVERKTLNIDPDRIQKAITPRTKAILPVHFAGRPCEMDPILELAQRYGLLVIEDAAHCIEGWYKGKKIGNIGDITCFSFYVTKNVITGEGGMVTTRHESYADKIKMYGLHGMTKDAWKRFSDEGYKHYQVVFPGFKYNMMDLQAALGIHQLRRVEENLLRRNEIWKRYDEALAELPLTLPAPVEPYMIHARHLYTVLLHIDRIKKSRDQVLNELIQENIGTGVHYTALHLHPYYRQAFGYKPGDFPNAEYIGERTLSLPLSPKLTDEDVEDVIKALKKVLG
ncbi:MAG TPA: DegT/DnrJ/EryC1/StrS family aminotransferase [Candidatus Limnocylindrales bacterium]|nr:DegT/DnrJ/EryC1/StrS family aminotransferase [Candidatus Limnocylindrales bacterium]